MKSKISFSHFSNNAYLKIKSISQGYLKMLLLTFSLLFNLNIFSQNTLNDKSFVDVDEAYKLAINWIKLNGKNNYQVKEIHKNKFNQIVTYYVVQLKPEGFVIISSTKNVVPVLGYSFKGKAPINSKNEALNQLLKWYSEQIYYAISQRLINRKNLKAWKDILNYNSSRRASIQNVGPLLSTTWGQECGYNDYTPTPGNFCNHAPTGCVATAMTQIMKYWNYPPSNSPIPGYDDRLNYDNNGSPISGSDYGWISGVSSVNYDWGNMHNNSGSDATAILMYHCGVSVKMNYGPNSSGAYDTDVVTAFQNYFNYSVANLYWKDHYSGSWENLLKNDLNNGHPIYYSGNDGQQGHSGHAFVVDGYTTTNSINYFHINWGWNGAHNGDYYLNNLTPGSGNYNYNQAAIVGIQPSNVTNTPPNDNCNNAITLQSHTSCQYTNGTVDGATSDNSWARISCDTYNGSNTPLEADVFYKFTAVSSSHTIYVNPLHDMDPVVGLYSGSDCYHLTEIDCADSGGGSGQSETIQATGLSVGQTYWIRIYDWGYLPPSNGDFEICVTHTQSTTPPNDNCNNAITLQSHTSCQYTNGTVDGATSDNSWARISCDTYNGSNTPLEADVFYKFTAVSSSHTIYVNPLHDMDPVVGLYSGSDCYHLTEIDCADSGGGSGQSETIQATGLSVGQTYWIRIYDWGYLPPSNGDFEICVTHTNTSNQPQLEVSSYIIDDDNNGGSSGNGNGHAEQGETIEMPVEIYNSGTATAHDVDGILSTSDPDITITDNDISTSLISVGARRWSGSFTFVVSNTCPEKDVTFNLNLTSNEGNWSDAFTVHIFNTSQNRTYVPDDNFEQALIDLGYDDILDDYVLTSNIENVQYLNISNKNINDLTGIEGFTSLRGLICNDNNLTSIDLSGNLQLRDLLCYRNQLSTINVSNNTQLENLKIANNNIHSLDLTNNPNLQVLVIQNNNITNFNNIHFNNYSNLTRLYIMNNPIIALDLSHFTNLESLNCSDCNLSQLNLRNGNNQNLVNVWVTNNPNLHCIQVDDETSANNGTGSYANWVIDSWASYSENCSVNVEEYLIKQIKLIPNPTGGQINIEYLSDINIDNIMITNSLGQMLYYFGHRINTLDIQNLPKGIYFLTIRTKNNNTVTLKIIKD